MTSIIECLCIQAPGLETVCLEVDLMPVEDLDLDQAVVEKTTIAIAKREKDNDEGRAERERSRRVNHHSPKTNQAQREPLSTQCLIRFLAIFDMLEVVSNRDNGTR